MKGQGRAERTLSGINNVSFFFSVVMTHKGAAGTCVSSVERVRVVGFHPNEVLAISSLSPRTSADVND